VRTQKERVKEVKRKLYKKRAKERETKMKKTVNTASNKRNESLA
jgi:hypothetical protein